MSHDLFNMSIDAPVEIRQNAYINDIKRDNSSPTGIMIKIGRWAGPAWNESFYWVPYHYHCDEDEIDTDGWLSARVFSVNLINVAWDTKQNIPLYCYTTKESVYYHNECHSARIVSIKDTYPDIGSFGQECTIPFLNIRVTNPFGPGSNRSFDCRNMGMEWYPEILDLNYYPTVIRIDQQNIDEFVVCFWRFSDGTSKVAHFKIITDPPTQDPEYRGVYNIINVEYIGIEDKNGVIIDIYHSGNIHKTLTMGTWSDSPLIFGEDQIGDNPVGAMVLNAAKILGPDNVVFTYYDGHNILWKSIKGSPIDGWQVSGILNERYYNYPIGINTIHRPINGSYSFWIFDGWYSWPPNFDPFYWRYGSDKSAAWWTSKGIKKAFAPGPALMGYAGEAYNQPAIALVGNTDNDDLGFARNMKYGNLCLSRMLDTMPISACSVNYELQLKPYQSIYKWAFGAQCFDAVILPYSYFKGK